MLTLDLPDELDKRLDALVRETGRSKADHALAALAEYVGDLEDLHIAEARLRDRRVNRRQNLSSCRDSGRGGG